MSWDILLFNCDDINVIEGGDFPDFVKEEFIEKVTTSIPEIKWNGDSWGSLESKEASIDFNVGEEDVLGSVMLHVYGGSNPVIVISKLCIENNWQAYDISGETYLDKGQTLSEGFDKFKEYKNIVLSNFSGKKWWQFWK